MFNEKSIMLFKDGAKEFGINLSDEDINSFEHYARLLVEWNQKMNLTAIIDEEGIITKHFVDSLSIVPFLDEKDKTLIDVGTGAGFPGIPIKIVRNIKITLLDSLEKRTKFLKEVCSSINLKNISQVHGRAEDFGVDKKYREQFDVATARAVANLPVLLEYCLPFVKVGGKFIAMKGPDAVEELKESKNAIELLGGQLEDVKSFNLPNSDMERTLVIIRKFRQTPAKYPRKSGKPTKEPLK